MASRRWKSATRGVSLRETLISAGLEAHFADLLDEMEHRLVQVEPRRPFREQGAPRNEVMFVRSGILSKFKTDSAGRRQIVALRFPGEGILPRNGPADYGIQAIVRSEVMVGRAEDFDPIVDAHPEMQRFFWRLIQRNEAIGYEWLVNCGRRDSTARVAHLLQLAPRARRLVLVGSSMGGYVAAHACAALKPQALFLMAPALYFPGWDTEPAGIPGLCSVVHGWRDDIVPVERGVRFAQAHRAALHVLDADHGLNDQLPTLELLLGELLDRVKSAA